jgi:hypothetical protein
MANAEAQWKDGVKSFPGRRGVSMCELMIVSDLMEKRNPLNGIIFHLVTGHWIRFPHGPIISLAVTTMGRTKFRGDDC